MKGGRVAHLAFEPEIGAVPEARQHVLDRCRSWGVPESDLSTIAVVVSELVTNAVRHAHTQLDVLVECEDEWVRLAVADQSLALPVRPEPDPSQPGGLGLLLIDKLAARWGVTSHTHGKSVWAVVPVTTRSAENERALNPV